MVESGFKRSEEDSELPASPLVTPLPVGELQRPAPHPHFPQTREQDVTASPRYLQPFSEEFAYFSGSKTTTWDPTTTSTAGLGGSEGKKSSKLWAPTMEAIVGLALANIVLLKIPIVGLTVYLWWKRSKGKWSGTPNLSPRFPAQCFSEPTAPDDQRCSVKIQVPDIPEVWAWESAFLVTSSGGIRGPTVSVCVEGEARSWKSLREKTSMTW